jgi:glycosyltransferase involved in cell wall biosynthesis
MSTSPTQPIASILIPTFNRPDRLAESISSALAQTVDEIEVVVGDDGALGGRVVDAIGDPRVRYQANETRLGIAGNWQRLLDGARGAFVSFLMDDDLLEPGFLARCLAEFASDPELGVVFTNHTFVFSDGRPEQIRSCDLAAGRHDRFGETFVRLKPVAISAALWRAEIWPAIRPLPNSGAADMVLFGRIAELGWPFHYVDEALMKYGVHQTNYSSRLAFRDDCVRAWDSLVFSDPRAQRQRDRRLADALLSRAAAQLREHALAEARRDIRRAWSLRPTSRTRALVVALAASNHRAASGARWLTEVKHARGAGRVSRA